jgi:pilus assembly protein CpaB
VARRTLLIIASILLAALGTALIWLYVQGAENRATQNAQLVPALFLARDVAAGQSPATAVRTQNVPPAVAAGAVTSLQELGSQRLQVAGVAGQILLKSMLSTSGASTGNFPAGGVASLTISDPNRVPAELTAGDVVDVVRLTKDRTEVLLRDITVRSVGPVTQGATGTTAGSANGTAAGSANGTAAGSASGTAQNGSIPPSIVALNVSQAQAVALYAAVAHGDQMAVYLHGTASP